MSKKKVGAEEPNIETIAFMQEMMSRIDGGHDSSSLIDLLVDEKLMKPSQSRKVYRWIAGTSSPELGSALALLRLAGVLDITERASGLDQLRQSPDAASMHASLLEAEDEVLAKTKH